jgi:ribose 5-phosphate isomerase B
MSSIIKREGYEIPIGDLKDKVVVLGSDHRGFEYKQRIAEFLKGLGYETIDVGTFSKDRCDYPGISDKIGEEVERDYLHRVGIGICGSGIGILIPASKHKRVLTARCLTDKEAETSRKHNNSNVLGIGADYINLETAFLVIRKWLETGFYSGPEDESYLNRYIQTLKLEERVGK